MAKQKKEKDKDKYKIVFYNETSLREINSWSVTPLNIVAYAGVIFVIVVLVAVLILIYSPINRLLPRQENADFIQKIEEYSVRVDSVEKVLETRVEFFSSIRNIMTNNPQANGSYADTVISNDSKVKIDKFTEKKQDSLLRSIIEIETKATSEIINETAKKEKHKTFFNPIRGMVTSRFDAVSGHLGIDIAAKEGEPVLAAYPGTVILATWSSETGNVIQIQHVDNFISIYKHNSALLKKVGDKVSTGEPIAIVGNSGEFTSGTHLHFELWHNGVAVDPEKYIIE
ncbi:MAG: M23 family metallopeptidase [Bacteroidales bacterium]|nr:M23 family metallopeptidase [Bacteroidales bacterium]